MSHILKHIRLLFVLFCFAMISLAFSQESNDAIEPILNKGTGAIDLLEGGTLDVWNVPSARWYVEGESIVGHTGEEKLQLPEWLYTKQSFSDFEFTCELKLTGDNRRNTGIYYRVNTFLFEGYKTFEAPSGYEFDAAFHNPDGKNYWGSLGDWYARKSLRIYPDQNIIIQAYNPEKWNRLTLRARGNRLEYWINGIKVVDYLDDDPEASGEGVIGLQIHDGSEMKVEFRNLRVLSLEQ